MQLVGVDCLLSVTAQDHAVLWLPAASPWPHSQLPCQALPSERRCTDDQSVWSTDQPTLCPMKVPIQSPLTPARSMGCPSLLALTRK
jgi:hypothetical protein